MCNRVIWVCFKVSKVTLRLRFPRNTPLIRLIYNVSQNLLTLIQKMQNICKKCNKYVAFFPLKLLIFFFGKHAVFITDISKLWVCLGLIDVL